MIIHTSFNTVFLLYKIYHFIFLKYYIFYIFVQNKVFAETVAP